MTLFQLFYYLKERLSITNGLLPISDAQTPDGSEKISLKALYKMLKDKKSHRLVSIQFLSTLNLFFGGEVQLSKDTITELSKNLSLRTLSGEQQCGELTAHINFKMKHCVLANIDDEDKATKTNNENVKDMYEFFKK